jgi:acetoacetate decarboxylase
MIFRPAAIGFVLLLSLLLFLPTAGAQDFEGTHLSSNTLPYGAPPFTYEGSRFLSITFKTSPDVLRAMVPEPLTPNPDNLMSILVADHHIAQPAEVSYLEAILAVPVSHEDFAGIYMPVLYLDEVIPIIGGREIWGFSKVEAEIQMSDAGGTMSASVVRNGTTLIDISAQLGEPVVPVPELPNDPMLNLKLIPSVKKGAPPDVKQLTSTVSRDVKTHVVRGGVGKIALDSIPSDPLGSIPVVEIVSLGYQEQDFVLDYGEVVLDYLNPSGRATSRSDSREP